MNGRKTVKEGVKVKKLVRFLGAAALFVILALPVQAKAADIEADRPIELSKTNITMITGTSYVLKLEGEPKEVTWSTSKKSVAQIADKKQLSVRVTAKRAGTAKITAKAGEKSYTCKVKVVSAKLKDKKKTLKSGDSFALKVTGKKISKWKSSDTSVAEVNTKGKVTAKKSGKVTITGTIGVSKLKCIVTVKADRWSKLLDKYYGSKKVKQLVFVKYTGGSKAKVMMYSKKAGGWECILECQGYVGQKGIDKRKEGDRKTPTGVFNLTEAFGIKANPGTMMPYIDINKHLYWCADKEHYNQLIDVRETPHKCNGEHLIDYVPQYNYGMVVDYNSRNVYKKGSAIFLHCKGKNSYTLGCIAVSEKNMIKILKNAEPGTKICIY